MDQTDKHIETLKRRMQDNVAVFKHNLKPWIRRNSWPDDMTPLDNEIASPYFVEVTAALLETAFEREIDLLGVDDARDIVLRCFERVAERCRKKLH